MVLRFHLFKSFKYFLGAFESCLHIDLFFFCGNKRLQSFSGLWQQRFISHSCYVQPIGQWQLCLCFICSFIQELGWRSNSLHLAVFLYLGHTVFMVKHREQERSCWKHGMTHARHTFCFAQTWHTSCLLTILLASKSHSQAQHQWAGDICTHPTGGTISHIARGKDI